MDMSASTTSRNIRHRTKARRSGKRYRPKRKRQPMPRPQFYMKVFLFSFFFALAATGIYFIVTDIRQTILRIL